MPTKYQDSSYNALTYLKDNSTLLYCLSMSLITLEMLLTYQFLLFVLDVIVNLYICWSKHNNTYVPYNNAHAPDALNGCHHHFLSSPFITQLNNIIYENENKHMYLIMLLSCAHAPDFKIAAITTSPFITQLNNIIYENENKQYSFCAR